MRIRTAGPETNSEKSDDLIRRLGSRDAEERRVARDEFLRMATADPALFHADLNNIIHAVTGNKRRMSVGIVAMLVAVYPATWILMGLAQTMDTIFPIVWALAMLVLLVIGGIGIFRAAVGPRRRRLAECITDIDDLNALPALIELLEFTGPAVQKAILPPITHLLLRLRASDAYLLGFLHRSALARVLSTPRMRKLPAAFFVAVLQSFEQIGDSQALPAVSWLAQGKGAAGDHSEIQASAQACLACLQAQLSRHQAPYLLLRPSSLAEAPHTLLRPVATAPDAAPHELLRPDNSLPDHISLSAYIPQEDAPELLPLRLQGQDED